MSQQPVTRNTRKNYRVTRSQMPFGERVELTRSGAQGRRQGIQMGLLATAALVLFVVFSMWSGVPTGERARPFWLGVALLAIMLAAFGWITWYLLLSPLPYRYSVAQPIKASYRQAVALLLGVGGYGMSVGSFWDEIWHRQYGIPFGEDFFWRPHLLMYFSIGVTTLLAFAGLYLIIRRGAGTLQQRFRANPLMGAMVLVGGLHMFVLPVDPIWHEIYGEDLTAWSVPHLLLFVTFNSSLLLAAAIHMTARPNRKWDSPRQLSLADALPLLLFAALSLSWNQFFTTEWDGAAGLVPGRPEWLLPVMIVSGAALVGVMANHTLRVYGAATLTGVLALVIRFALIQLFNAEPMMRVNSWVLALPSLVLVDLWYAYRLSGPWSRQRATGGTDAGQSPHSQKAWVGAGGAAAVGMGIMLLTIFRDFYPLARVTNLPVALVAVLVGSLGMSWLGAAIGDYLADGNKQMEDAAAGPLLSLALLGVTGATVVFLIFFVTTATPPA